MSSQDTPNTEPKPSPGIGAGAALGALRTLAGPLAELALQAGLNHAQLDELWRMALVDEASKRMGNVSRVSVATGLHRKEVVRLQTALALAATGAEQLPKKRPWASQLVLLWADWVSREPYLAVLPLALDDSPKPCFAKLSRQVTTDVHPRAVLQELLRLGLVSEANGQVSLLSPHFVARGSADDALGLLTDNLQDHLQTGLRNIAADVQALQTASSPNDASGPAPHKWVEQAIWAEGISEADAHKLNATAREAWANAYRALYKQLVDTPEASADQGRVRIRVGLYVSAQAMPGKATTTPAQPTKPTQKPTSSRSKRKLP